MDEKSALTEVTTDEPTDSQGILSGSSEQF